MQTRLNGVIIGCTVTILSSCNNFSDKNIEYLSQQYGPQEIDIAFPGSSTAAEAGVPRTCGISDADFNAVSGPGLPSAMNDPSLRRQAATFVAFNLLNGHQDETSSLYCVEFDDTRLQQVHARWEGNVLKIPVGKLQLDDVAFVNEFSAMDKFGTESPCRSYRMTFSYAGILKSFGQSGFPAMATMCEMPDDKTWRITEFEWRS